VIYIFYIVLSLKARAIAESDNNPDDNHRHDRRSSSASLLRQLIIPRSIRFQDEEFAHSGSHDAPTDESIELGALPSAETGEHDLVDTLPVSEREATRGRQSTRHIDDKVQPSKSSIYTPHTRLNISDSRASSHRRLSIASSTVSLPLPPLLLGRISSRTSIDDSRNMCLQPPPKHKISLLASIILLLASSLLIALCAECLVNTIDDLTALPSSPFSTTFIALIVLPIAGNCAEQISSLTLAAHGNLNLAIAVAVGSSIQISLFVTPVVVIVGWCLGRQLGLNFSMLETVGIVASAAIVAAMVLGRKVGFLEGVVLCACYAIISVAAGLMKEEGQ
jgi:Ca2+/H+ antiporter